jgi:GntR family transcriptional regulator
LTVYVKHAQYRHLSTESSSPVLKWVLPPVSAARGGPLYAQVVEGIKLAISRGDLVPLQLLPSFRQLAEQLMVSVITVKRAYEELEQEGIIFRRQGQGTFVADVGVVRTRESRLRSARLFLDQALAEAKAAGLRRSEVRDLFLETLKCDDHDSCDT